jgi:ADP-ribose pyrophosphatase YjhB (NUDIX family)
MTDDGDPFVGKISQKAVLFGPDGDVLVCRVDDHWEPPGGTFEYGETLAGGLRRELREELSVDAAYGGWFDGETGDPIVVVFYRRSRPSASGLDPEGEGRQKTYRTK